jgi:hypothetical protein
MFLRGSRVGRSASSLHKVVGVVTFLLSIILLVMVYTQGQ